MFETNERRALMPPAPFNVRITREIAKIDAAQWDVCANPPGLCGETAGGERFNPFITHAFLNALEQSGSVGGRSGWAPMHVIVEDKSGRLVAAAPTYAKSHSQGEYVFDHGWAQAYERAGGRYYPKVQVAVPFTPATGRRLLVAADAPAGARAALVAGLRGLCEAIDASSIHITFADAADRAALESEGFFLRTGEQFHFANPGYADFEAFLAELASRKRKNIRRERKDALADGIAIEWVSGAALKPEHWEAFFAFYMDTGSRKWGRPYLTRRFFDLVGASMAERVLLVLARREGRYIAGAINFIGDDALYGRNWGSIEEHPFLHFEVCYYQAIDYAIQHRLKRVEAGAQGEHKLARGYRPVPTFSLHHFTDRRLGEAVAEYLVRERVAVEETIALYEEHAPFRKG
jgi:predicted N-acyltransferase